VLGQRAQIDADRGEFVPAGAAVSAGVQMCREGSGAVR
jgi:hypothetical protein